MKCRCFALSKQKKKSYNIFAILDPWWSSNILFISHGIYSIWSHSNAFVMSVEKRLVLGLSEKIFHVSTFISSFTIFIAELSCCFCKTVNGTTSEGNSLTKKERKKVAEKWILTSSGRLELTGIYVSLKFNEYSNQTLLFIWKCS